MPAQVLPELQWHPLRYEDDCWLCPRTGQLVPKTLEKNLAFRDLVKATCADGARGCLTARAVQWQMCKRSFLYWLNTFGYTYVVIEHTFAGRSSAKDTHQPFITFLVQDTTAEHLITSTGHYGDPCESVCIDKSREMGATWLSIAIMVWFLIFHPDRPMLICADREDAVDYPGKKPQFANPMTADKNTLMGKMDYLIGKLPIWMQPPIERSYLVLAHKHSGTRIDGSSTREDLGRGARPFLVFVDEAASIRPLKQIDKSTSDATACRWFNSTPKGAHYFTELRSSGKLRVCVMGWWDDPRKAIDGPNGEPGRYITHDDDKGEQVITGWWRELEKKRRVSAQDVAENIDIDHLGAGRVVFDLGVLNRHLSLYACAPWYRTLIGFHFEGGTLDAHLRKRNLAALRFEEAPEGGDDQGKLLMWCDLVWDEITRMWRPPQNRTYVVSADPSPGQGAANTVIVVRDCNTGEKVAELADARMGPDDAARVMVALGIWFGGTRGYAYLIWEANGVGGRLGDMLVKLAYPWLHVNQMGNRRFRTAESDQAPRLGWWSTPQAKSDMIHGYRASLGSGAFINHSNAALQEAMKWVRYENNTMGPGQLEFETSEARATHGDRVIADALSEVGRLFAGLTVPEEAEFPIGSVGRQLAEEERLEQQAESWDDPPAEADTL